MEPHRTPYRPDIDGLRAIAVLSVIACHGRLGLPGGYVGVDVFFVISGYLISSLILKDIRQGTFSLADFWERRIRRILPALLVVTVSTMLAGWFALIPDAYAALARSITGLVLLVSNIHFWRNTGYFAPSAEEIPLLHTWSLAVEEQFYLFVPVFLILIARAGHIRRAMPLLVLIAFVSFSLSLSGGRDPAATFYLLPTRAWELLAGTFLAFLSDRRSSGSRRWKEAGSVIGLTLILIPCLVYDQNTKFPGLAALPPVVGTVFLIWTGIHPEHTSVTNRCLAWRPLVFVGLISYSLYLWHWPVLVFSQLNNIHGIRWPGRILLVLGTFLIAIASWRYVELPFRRRQFLASRRRLLAFAGMAFFGLLGGSLLIDQNRGYEQRFSAEALKFAAAGQQDKRYIHEQDVEDVPGNLTRFGPVGTPAEILVWGDSHAMAVLPAFEAISLEKGVVTLAATHSSTAPVIDYISSVGRYSLRERSVAYNSAVMNYARSGAIRAVVLVGMWGGYFRDQKFEAALLRSIDYLQESGVVVYFMLDVPNFKFNVSKALTVCSIWGRDADDLAINLDDYNVTNQFHATLLPQLESRGVHILDPIPLLRAKAGVGANRIMPFDSGGSLYSDNSHLTTHGSLAIKGLFLPVFR